MQAIRTPQQQNALTVEQSLASVQTLLRAGLGCITYLRNLLPEYNFHQTYLTSSNTSSLSSPSVERSRSSSTDDASKGSVSGFKIMTISRGLTKEADDLLDYMENGIFDALQRQYLKSFIFGVCLDGQDPNNIVEAYTFNFRYQAVSGSDLKVPVMTLGEDLMKLSLNRVSVPEAASIPGIPTLGDVKKSLRMLARNLIQVTTHMEALPKRRFATFKLFYYDHTPEDYNPPHFRPGDAKKDRWFFTTHDVSEVPEKYSVGTLDTGWHGVDVRVTSIASFLPSSDDNNAMFTGTACAPGAGQSLTPAEETTKRMKHLAIQSWDADQRRVVYDADGLCDEDAEGVDDPDYIKADATGEVPIGIRNDEKVITPLLPVIVVPPVNQGSTRMDVDITSADICTKQPSMFVNPPQHIRQLKIQPQTDCEEKTQQLAPTQSNRSPTPRSRDPVPFSPTSLPPSMPDESSIESVGSRDIDTQVLKDQLISSATAPASATDDSEMLDMETQMPSYPNEDPIESFHTEEDNTRTEQQEKDVTVPDRGLDCECGVNIEDCDTCWCNKCGRWYHVWCMGYNAAEDPRMPDTFICFDCRVRADKNWELIVLRDIYFRMISKFREIALFRRALKIFEQTKPEGVSGFAKKIGCASDVAGQLFKRLEAEGFIAQETKECDELGLMEVHKRSARVKGKAPETRRTRQRKQLLRTKYVFVQASKKASEYKEYFNPDPEVEQRLLGLKELIKNLRASDTNAKVLPDATSLPNPQVAALDSQTQEDTQFAQLISDQNADRVISDLKRKTSGEEHRHSKKIKISLAPMVDLGE